VTDTMESRTSRVRAIAFSGGRKVTTGFPDKVGSADSFDCDVVFASGSFFGVGGAVDAGLGDSGASEGFSPAAQETDKLPSQMPSRRKGTRNSRGRKRATTVMG